MKYLFLLLVVVIINGSYMLQSDKISSKDVTYFSLNQDTCIGKFIDNKREGLWHCHYLGQKDEIIYRNGLFHGIFKIYSKKGNLIIEESFVNGFKHGAANYYNEGKLQYVYIYDEGKKTYSSEYYDDGQIKEYGSINQDTVLLKVIEYDSQGNEEKYLQKTISDVKDKDWCYFTNRGKLVLKEYYDSNQLIRRDSF